MDSPSEITDLLIRWGNGDQAALERLAPLVERKLHELAHYYMLRENPGHTLQTTALVNEAYLRLIDQNRVQWQNRAHFYGIAAQMMRRILLNHARDQKRAKRGGGAVHVSLSMADVVSDERSVEMIALDDLSVEETAEVLNISPITVTRDWNMARAWLAREIADGA
jgi:RNA polymerase sigma factor (TIGR02999 family)